MRGIALLIFAFLISMVQGACPKLSNTSDYEGNIIYNTTAHTRPCKWFLPRLNGDYVQVLRLTDVAFKYGEYEFCAGYLSLPGFGKICKTIAEKCFAYASFASSCDFGQIRSNLSGFCSDIVLMYDTKIPTKILLESFHTKKKAFTLHYKLIRCEEHEVTDATATGQRSTVPTAVFSGVVVLLCILLVVALLGILWVKLRNCGAYSIKPSHGLSTSKPRIENRRVNAPYSSKAEPALGKPVNENLHVNGAAYDFADECGERNISLSLQRAERIIQEGLDVQDNAISDVYATVVKTKDC